jgi:predicted HTH domain antitoxin
MTDPRPQTPTQLQLLDDSKEELVLQESEVARGVFSGERLCASDPERYKVIVTLLAEGRLSLRQIAKLTSTSRNLLAVIKRERQADIEPLRRKLAGDFYLIAELANERLIETLTDPAAQHSLAQLSIAAGTAFDKAQLASGGPTSITGTQVQPGAGDVDEYLVLARRSRIGVGVERNGVKEAEGVVVGPARALVGAGEAAAAGEGEGAGEARPMAQAGAGEVQEAAGGLVADQEAKESV